MSTHPYLSLIETGRELHGRTVNSVKRLRAGGLLETDPTNANKITRDSVDALKAQMKISIPSRRPVLRVPLAPEKLGSSMLYVKGKNDADIREYDDYLKETGREHLTFKPGERMYSGAWEITDEDADLLVKEGGIICGSVVGWINQAAQILEHVKNIPYRNRKIFVVRPLHGEELAPWKAYIASNSQGPQMLL